MVKKIVSMILAFGLTATFFEKLIESADNLYPNRSNVTVGMGTLPKWLHLLYPIHNVLSGQPGIVVLLILSIVAFGYEVVTLIKIIWKKPPAVPTNADDED